MKVLIAVEDEQFARAISNFVTTQQDWPENTEFRVLHVVEPLYLGAISGYPQEVLVDFQRDRHDSAKELLSIVTKKLRMKYPSNKIDEHTLEGHPAETIVKTSQEWPADLIVVGSHGRKGLNALLLGSVSGAVLSAAKCSVTIVKMTDEMKDRTQQQHVQNEKTKMHIII
jgi:nucleotide-binding universal stress UspA family protein